MKKILAMFIVLVMGFGLSSGVGVPITKAATATLTVETVGGLRASAYVEVGKTLKLVALDSTGVLVPATYALALPDPRLMRPISATAAAAITPDGLVLGLGLGVQIINAASPTGATGTFTVTVIAPQVITGLGLKLVPRLPITTSAQQFAALGGNAAYPLLDYTTNVVWTSTLPLATLSSTAPTHGLLTYTTNETGEVTATFAATTTFCLVLVANGLVTITNPLILPASPHVMVLAVGFHQATVNGRVWAVPVAPEIVAKEVFVPLRFIAEAFGATLTWVPSKQQVTGTLGTTTLALQLGNTTTVLNGKIILLATAPYSKQGCTMVPLHVIAEAFGGNVAWEPVSQIITISYMFPSSWYIIH
jgi:hypothetical protein